MSEIEYTEHGWRRATDALRHHRERVWDYKGRAVYHVTLAVEGRFPLFGELVGASPAEARVELTEMGRYVRDTLRGLPAFYAPKGIKIRVLATQVMPDHLHAVIHVQEQMPKSIGEVVRSFKSACTSWYKRRWAGATEGSGGSSSLKNERGVDDATMMTAGAQAGKDEAGAGVATVGAGAAAAGAGAATVGAGVATVGVGAATVGAGVATVGAGVAQGGAQRMVQFCRIFASRGSIWEFMPAGYHEKILHCEGQLERMIRYVKDNPRRLWLKRHNPELFKLRKDVLLTFTSGGQVVVGEGQGAGGALGGGVQSTGHSLVGDGQKASGALVGDGQNAGQSLVDDGRNASGALPTGREGVAGDWHRWRFRMMGNMFLLDFALKQYVQCSRRATSHEIESMCEAVLEKARNGFVTVTAAISEGEKSIARTVREAGFPLVILLKDGFPKVGAPHERYYKPGGVYFDACAEGRLLLMEPYPEVLDDASVAASVEGKAPSVPKGSMRYHFLALNYVAWCMGGEGR